MRIAREEGAQTGDADAVRALFDSGTEGNRIYALGLIQGNQELAQAEPLLDAITAPHTAFEQYQALAAAWSSWPSLRDHDRARLREALHSVQEGGRLGPSGSDRQRVAKRILEADSR